MNALCLYHNDADGACAAWAVRRLHPDAECVPVRYGDPPPLELADGRPVYVVDFSYPTDDLVALALAGTRIVVVDHHKTGRDRLYGLVSRGEAPDHGFDLNSPGETIRVVWDEHRAGCGIAWDNLVGEPRPWWVDYVEDRDLWRFELADSKAVNAYLGTLPLGPDAFDELEPLSPAARSRAPRDVVAMGGAVLAYQAREVGFICRQAYRARLPRVHPYEAISINGTWEDRRGSQAEVPIVNTNTLPSEVGHALAEGEPFSATWSLRGDGRVRWSLRSVELGEDVSEIAKQYGGGGHKHAAGFHTTAAGLDDSLPRVTT